MSRCVALERVKLLSAAGSAAVLFNGINESWRLTQKILSQFKLLWFLNVFLVTHYTRHSPLENSKKNPFAAGSAEQLNSPLVKQHPMTQLSSSLLLQCRLNFSDQISVVDSCDDAAVFKIVSQHNSLSNPE